MSPPALAAFICSSSMLAGSSFGSWGTSLPLKARFRIAWRRLESLRHEHDGGPPKRALLSRWVQDGDLALILGLAEAGSERC